MTHHTEKAVATGNSTLALIRTLPYKCYGITSTKAWHLIFGLLLPKILCAYPAWWTGSQAILDRKNKMYLSALQWTSGLVKSTLLRKLHTVIQVPSLNLWLDYLSLFYAIWLPFSPPGHPIKSIPNIIKENKTIRTNLASPRLHYSF